MGSSEDIRNFWALNSFLFDIATEFLASSFCTGEFGLPFDLDAVRIMARLANDVREFKTMYTKFSSSPLAAYMAGQLDPYHPEPENPWDWTSHGVKVSPRASYFARQVSNYVSSHWRSIFEYSNSYL